MGLTAFPEPAMSDPTAQDQFASEAERIAKDERDIQAKIDREEPSFAKKKDEEQPQTGARPYPVPPFPAQHQAKPGVEARLDPQPLYAAPFWKGSGKLQDKVALLSGAA